VKRGIPLLAALLLASASMTLSVGLTYYRCEKPGCESLADDTLTWQK
jgi:hypothetical protein